MTRSSATALRLRHPTDGLWDGATGYDANGKARPGQAQEAFVRNLSFIRLLVALFGHIFVISLRFSNSFYCGKVKGALCAEHL